MKTTPVRFDFEEQQREYRRAICHEIDLRFEYALRHLVTPPIKGKISRGKIRWRGISRCKTPIDIKISDGNAILSPKIAIMQRNTLIDLCFQGEERERYEQWRNIKVQNDETKFIIH
ncbi:MAG: hypothetical protein IJ640_00195 [Prevotella sp.]|nr:hypothetical protein [Prevotella sp.]